MGGEGTGGGKGDGTGGGSGSGCHYPEYLGDLHKGGCACKKCLIPC